MREVSPSRKSTRRFISISVVQMVPHYLRFFFFFANTISEFLGQYCQQAGDPARSRILSRATP